MRAVFLATFAILISLALADDYRRSKDSHVNSIASSGFQGSYGGCRKKHPENRNLPGGAEACASTKPLKIKGLEKVSKRVCADGYEYCSVSHKSLHRLSWKPDTMPKSCFAFHYKKDKSAGYGHNCHRNLYFDGILCCPTQTHKTNHKLRIGSDKFQKHHFGNSKNSENYVKK